MSYLKFRGKADSKKVGEEVKKLNANRSTSRSSSRKLEQKKQERIAVEIQLEILNKTSKPDPTTLERLTQEHIKLREEEETLTAAAKLAKEEAEKARDELTKKVFSVNMDAAQVNLIAQGKQFSPEDLTREALRIGSEHAKTQPRKEMKVTPAPVRLAEARTHHSALASQAAAVPVHVPVSALDSYNSYFEKVRARQDLANADKKKSISDMMKEAIEETNLAVSLGMCDPKPDQSQVPQASMSFHQRPLHVLAPRQQQRFSAQRQLFSPPDQYHPSRQPHGAAAPGQWDHNYSSQDNEEDPQPSCKFGYSCSRTSDQHHMDKYSHPWP